MHFLVFLALVLTVVVTGCNRKPKEQRDQVSYSIGAQFGRSLKAQNLDLNTKSLSQGLIDGYKGEGKLTDEEMQAAMMKLSDDRSKDVKEESAKNKVETDGFLAKNKTAEGVRSTASGLQYKILDPGKGPLPKPEDVVVVNYKGTLVDGTEFDSSIKRGQPAEFPLRGVIAGWSEGLQLLKKGGKAILYVPPNLGYGERPRQQIPGNAVLIFEVELVEIKPAKK